MRKRSRLSLIESEPKFTTTPSPDSIVAACVVKTYEMGSAFVTSIPLSSSTVSAKQVTHSHSHSNRYTINVTHRHKHRHSTNTTRRLGPPSSTTLSMNDNKNYKDNTNVDTNVATNGSTRRQVLQHMMRAAIIATAAVTVNGIAAVPSAKADRTGKYSTKLTAKRRYLPRIARGLRYLKAKDAQAYVKVSEDFVTALRLFGTSYYAEGNRIGPLERELTDLAERIDEQTQTFVTKGASASTVALDSLLELVEQYVDVAKMQDSLVSFDTLP